MQAHLSLWLMVNTLLDLGAFSTCTVFVFLSSCGVVAPSSCCNHYCSCSWQGATLLLWWGLQLSLILKASPSFTVGLWVSSLVVVGVSSLVAFCRGFPQ